jgi:two-component system response regulator (stage 0 sporulation protein F)
MPKLLIVDDEIDVREFAKNFFKRRKIDVQTASNGEDALARLDSFAPDLIILDVRMGGGMDGIEVLKRIRESGKKTEVIMVSGVNETEVIEKANDLGVLGYIHKPLILEELEKVVLSRLIKKVGK